MCGGCRFVYCCDRGKLVCRARKRDASADFSASVSDHAFATVRLLWNNLKKRKLFDENLLILLAQQVHLQSIAIRRQWERCCFSRLESCWNLSP